MFLFGVKSYVSNVHAIFKLEYFQILWVISLVKLQRVTQTLLSALNEFFKNSAKIGQKLALSFSRQMAISIMHLTSFVFWREELCHYYTGFIATHLNQGQPSTNNA